MAIFSFVPTPSVEATRIWVFEAGRLHVEQASEAPKVGVGAGPPRGAREGGDSPDECLAGVDIDPGILVGEPVAAGSR